MAISDLRNIILSIYYHVKDDFVDWSSVVVLDSYANVDKSLPCIVVDYAIGVFEHLQIGDEKFNGTNETFRLQVYATKQGELRDILDKCLKALEEQILWIDYNTAFPGDTSYDEDAQKEGILTVVGRPTAEPVHLGTESDSEIDRNRGVVNFTIQRNN